MRTTGDVVILGGGVIGLTTAYFLARAGLRVQLLERARVGQEASWAGAGILAPSLHHGGRQPFDQLRALSNQLYPELSAELRQRTGIDNGYVCCGGLELVSQVESGRPHEWRGDGDPAELLDERDARRLEPALAHGLGRAFHLPTLAQVRNPRQMQALHAACREMLRVHEEAAPLEIRHNAGRVTAIETSTGTLDGDVFVIAAGAWTDALLKPLGWRTGIAPVRGQIALLNPGRPLLRRVLLWGARYLVPRLDGRVLVGSTEENAGFEKNTTAEGISGLLELALAVVPELKDAALERCWAGLRPGSPDGLPFIGKVPGFDNLYVAAGHFRSGIQLAPATAQVLKEMILGETPSLPIDAFRLDRSRFV